MNPNKSQMNPGETRNLAIFIVVSLLLYFAYNTFVLEPQAAEMRRQQAERQELIASGAIIPEALQIDKKPMTIAEALTAPDRVKIVSDKIDGSIDLEGARLDYVMLHDYFTALDKQTNVNILAPNGTEYPRSIEHGWVASDTSVQTPDSSTRWQIAPEGPSDMTPETPVTLRWENGQGITFEQILSIDAQYLVTIEQRVINNSNRPVTLFPYGIVSQKGLPASFENNTISHEGLIAYVDGDLEEIKYKKMRKEKRAELEGSAGWIGLTDKYWLTGIMPPQGAQNKFRFHYTGTPPRKKEADTGRYQIDYTGAAVTIAAGESQTVQSHAFVGPKTVTMLKDYSKQLGVPRLDLAVNFGMFWFFTVPFFYGLHYLALAVGNVGVAIILLTLIIRTAASPLTYSSYKSFAKMKKVMPEVNKLKAKYGEKEKQKFQQEMLALYQKEGVNPAAGCFPILLQIPIFFAFYKILFITIEIRHQPFFGWIKDLSAPDPTTIFNLFGLIPWDPPSFLMIGIWPCLMLVAMQIQQRLNPPPADPIQRDIARWFPFIMTFVMSHFASGLVIYWTISAFFGVAQQAFIMRKMGVPIHLFGETKDNKEAKEVGEHASDPEKLGPYSVSALKDEIIHEIEEIKHIKPPKPRKKKKK